MVAFQSNRLFNPLNLSYGILSNDIDEYDCNSLVIDLDNEYIINRKIEYKDENGYYRVYDAQMEI